VLKNYRSGVAVLKVIPKTFAKTDPMMADVLFRQVVLQTPIPIECKQSVITMTVAGPR
jgi:hypothetical protein